MELEILKFEAYPWGCRESIGGSLPIEQVEVDTFSSLIQMYQIISAKTLASVKNVFANAFASFNAVPVVA